MGAQKPKKATHTGETGAFRAFKRNQTGALVGRPKQRRPENPLGGQMATSKTLEKVENQKFEDDGN